ncbi:hypothetical protein ACFFRR_003000 [Megaselia abdita]
MSLQLTTFSILFGYCIFTSMALPITSKPIENTPEHLAWEEWLMNHPHDFHQNKTKKVTPKSIFLFRNKTTITSIATEIQCPPNHRPFDGKCIPTVEIDRDQILLNQLHNLLNNEQGTDYDYDYESQPGSDEEVDSLPVATVDKGDQQPFKVQFTLGESPNHTRINDDAAAEDTEAEFWQKFRDSVITTTTATTSQKTMETKNIIAEAVNELSDMEMSESDQTTKIIKGDLLASETNESSNDLKRQLVEESFMLQPSTTTTEDVLMTTTTEISSPDYFTELTEDDERLQSTTAKILNIETTTIESSGDDEVVFTTTTTYPEELESTTMKDALLMLESQQEEMRILDVPTIKLTDDDTHIDPTASTHSEASKRFVYHHTDNEVVSKNQKQPMPVRFKARYAASAKEQASSSTTTTTISTTTEKSATGDDEDEDYWWLPSGWRLDQSSDKPLLLRFWSQLPSLYSS